MAQSKKTETSKTSQSKMKMDEGPKSTASAPKTMSQRRTTAGAQEKAPAGTGRTSSAGRTKGAGTTQTAGRTQGASGAQKGARTQSAAGATKVARAQSASSAQGAGKTQRSGSKGRGRGGSSV